MKKCILLAVFGFILNSFPQVVNDNLGFNKKQIHTLEKVKSKHVENDLLVTLNKDISKKKKDFSANDFDLPGCNQVVVLSKSIREAIDKNTIRSVEVKENYKAIVKITIKQDKFDLEDIKEKLLNIDGVESVSYNNVYESSSSSVADYSSTVSYDWGINKINGYSAKSLSYGSKKPIQIGVLDHGIDGAHTYLYDNLYHNNYNQAHVDCSSGNGYTYLTTPTCTDSHGTHVAGVIGSKHNNTYNTEGVAKNVELISIKMFQDNTQNLLSSSIIQAVSYATSINLPIINFSATNPYYNQAECDAFSQYSGLIVCSAGNELINLDSEGTRSSYPTKYGLSNLISVGASDDSDYYWLTESSSNSQGSSGVTNTNVIGSNYGQNSVHVFAPGDSIWSTIRNNGYGYMSGTSMAAPYVSGLAALCLSRNYTLTPVQIKNYIVGNVDTVSILQNRCSSGGRINAYKTISAIPVVHEHYYKDHYVKGVLTYKNMHKSYCDCGDFVYEYHVANSGGTTCIYCNASMSGGIIGG